MRFIQEPEPASRLSSKRAGLGNSESSAIQSSPVSLFDAEAQLRSKLKLDLRLAHRVFLAAIAASEAAAQCAEFLSSGLGSTYFSLACRERDHAYRCVSAASRKLIATQKSLANQDKTFPRKANFQEKR